MHECSVIIINLFIDGLIDLCRNMLKVETLMVFREREKRSLICPSWLLLERNLLPVNFSAFDRA